MRCPIFCSTWLKFSQALPISKMAAEQKQEANKKKKAGRQFCPLPHPLHLLATAATSSPLRRPVAELGYI